MKINTLLDEIHDFVEEYCPHNSRDKLHTYWSCRGCPFFLTLGSHLDQEVINICFAYAVNEVGEVKESEAEE